MNDIDIEDSYDCRFTWSSGKGTITHKTTGGIAETSDPTLFSMLWKNEALLSQTIERLNEALHQAAGKERQLKDAWKQIRELKIDE
jgi:hypothetical protein